jgi:hypothetical protein
VKNNRHVLAFSVLAVLQMACVASVMQLPTQTSTAVPTVSSTIAPSPVPATRTATPAAEAETAIITAIVYVRQLADASSAAVGSLETGAEVEIVECTGEWCEVRTDVLVGFVWRGCLSDNPDNLKCEARP